MVQPALPHSELTPYLIFVASTISLGSLVFGYHIGELNTPKDAITICKDDAQSNSFDLPTCVPMDDETFSYVVSSMTIGGLIGSLLASGLADRYGRRGTLLGNTALLTIGSLLMGLAAQPHIMMIGRLIAGIGCGIVTVVVPNYLSEISPQAWRGTFGVFNQIGVVLGIFSSQALGLIWSTPHAWRLILLAGAALAVVHAALLPFCVESPRYLASRPGGIQGARNALQSLRGRKEVDGEIQQWKHDWQSEQEERLLSHHPDQQYSHAPEDEIETLAPTTPSDGALLTSATEPITPLTFLISPDYRIPLMIVLFVHLTQQFSGINGVVFYSTPILTQIFGATAAGQLTLLITFINFLATVASALLIDRVGRRYLLLLSIGSMAAVTYILAFSLERDFSYLSVAGLLAFIAAFAVGLGPIPFLIIPELVDTNAASSAGSVGLVTNWSANFVVSSLFLTLKKKLGGNVFFVFAVFLTGAYVVANKIVPETKGRSVEEVIRSNWAVNPTREGRRYGSFGDNEERDRRD